MKFLHSEKFFAALIAIIVIIFNLFPHAYQRYAINPADKIYIGAFPTIFDKPSYLAEIVQGKEGNWLMVNKYTTETQKGTLIYTFYIFLGHAAQFLDLSAETIFFLSRFFFGALLLFTVFYLIHYFVKDSSQRKIAYFFAFFVSGLGWLTGNPTSPDLWMPDAIPMVRFSHFPHLMLGNALVLSIFLLIYLWIKKRNSKPMIIAGIIAFILNFIVPFSTVLIYFFLITFSTLALLKKELEVKNTIRDILIFFAISLPSFIHMAYIALKDPLWKAVEKQDILMGPDLAGLAAGYGMILIFSLAGLRFLYKKDKLTALFFSFWIFEVLLLSQLPLELYAVKRRFLETGFYAPLAITASFGVMGIYYYLKNRQIKNLGHKLFVFSAIFIIPFMVLGNLQVWEKFNYSIRKTDDPRFYLPAAEIETVEWLRDNSPKDSIVLSSLSIGNVVPYYADRTVYLGFRPFTIDIDEKIKKASDFYSGISYSQDEMNVFLKKERINYVFYSDQEKTNGFNPDKYSFLKKVYENGDAAIYVFIAE